MAIAGSVDHLAFQKGSIRFPSGRKTMRLLKSALMLASLLSAFAASGEAARAADYPAGPLKIVVPYPAGGPTDFIARVVAQKLTEKLGGQFIVENLPGAGGAVGTGAVARAPADGRTIAFVVPDFVIAPIVKANVPFDPFKSFTPVINIAAAPEMFSVHPSVPAKDMRELLALLKANPGKYSYATPGYGTSPHLYSEWLFKLNYGLDVLNVPFPGALPAVQSTVAGQTQIIPVTVTAVAPLIKNGHLRGLAVAAHKRSPAVPDVPTLAEQGINGHEVDFWTGAIMPAGTPKAIVELLHDRIAEIMAQPDVKARLATIGFEPTTGTSEEFGAFLKAESDQWRKISSDAQIRIN
jgi:tripartite-type tricarboxylate transporter receptor subunit TctC